MIKYPFNIPGYGEIVDEDAFELFKHNYLHSMRTLHNLRVATNKPFHKQNVVVCIKGGAIQTIAVDNPECVLVTVVDDDNIKAGDTIINQGEWPTEKIDKSIEDYVLDCTNEDIFFFLCDDDTYSFQK